MLPKVRGRFNNSETTSKGLMVPKALLRQGFFLHAQDG
jgi:hypothetical protein